MTNGAHLHLLRPPLPLSATPKSDHHAGPEATDPADLQVHACAHLGLSRQLKQTCHATPHPSRGGSGYDTLFLEQLAKAAAREDV